MKNYLTFDVGGSAIKYALISVDLTIKISYKKSLSLEPIKR